VRALLHVIASNRQFCYVFSVHYNSRASSVRCKVHVRQACARQETRLDFTCARKSSSTLLQLKYRQEAQPHEPVARAARIACLVTCHIVHITREHSESHEHEHE
jgi:hypothetical protein